jgi:undecaprenyl-diphosphatase
VRRLLRAFLARVETISLILWLVVAGAVWGFLKFASEVGEGETMAVDRRILLALRRPGDPSDPIGPRSFEESMRDVTALGGVTVLSLITITATLALLFHGKRRQALVFAGTVIAAQVSAGLLKDVYDRPRPDLVPHGSYVYSASFPSGHSTLSAATYLTLAMVIPAWSRSRRPRR